MAKRARIAKDIVVNKHKFRLEIYLALEGHKDIVWEIDGFIDHSKLWITYEEVIDANAHQRSLQSEEGSRNRVGGTATG